MERKPVKFNNLIDREKTFVKSPNTNSINSLPSRGEQRQQQQQSLLKINLGSNSEPNNTKQKIFVVQQKPTEPQKIIVKGAPPQPTQILNVPRQQPPNLVVKGPPPFPTNILKIPQQQPQSIIIQGKEYKKKKFFFLDY